MNRIVALAACGLLFAAGEGRAQHALDPHLRHAEMLRRLSPAPPAEARPALPGHIAGRDPLIADGVAVIARVGPAGVAAIEGAGGVVRARVGDIVTATLPASSLHALASTSAVRWLEAALPLAAPVPAAVAPLLPSAAATTVLPTRSPFRLGAVRDAFAASASIELAAASGRAAAASGLDRLRQLRDDRFLGLTGAGVIIGIFDSGLDLEHPDFRDDDGATRVLWAWDQAAPDGVAPGTVGAHDFGYGRECTAADIDTGICPLRDLSGHGTHVLGVAAGGGRGSAQRVHAGAAPHADLIVVKGGDAGFTTDRVLDGVVYMVERATQLGRPLVITLALSTQSGPHDGTTLFEQALDALSAAGSVIVTVAGNHGDNRNETPPFVRHSLHAMGTAPAVHELVVPPYTPQPGAVTDAALIELWYDGGDELAVTVVAPGGESARAEPGDTVVVFTADGTIYIDNAFGGPRPNGDNSMLIAVFDGEEERPPSPGRWRIELERVGGSAALAAGHHLWLVASTIQNVASPITLAGGTTNTHLVSVPGTATRLITATAYATRFDWLGPDGTLETYPFQEELGDLAQFSSPGPRRDGVLKPDIAAPGKLLLAPRSRDAGIWAQLPWMIDATGRYAALLGTSMAAPHVAGVIALLLQLRPDLTTEDVKALLGATAAVDGFTGRGYQTPPAPPPNVHWGAGKLDALAAVRALGHPAGAIALTAQPARVSTCCISRSPPTRSSRSTSNDSASSCRGRTRPRPCGWSSGMGPTPVQSSPRGRRGWTPRRGCCRWKGPCSRVARRGGSRCSSS